MGGIYGMITPEVFAEDMEKLERACNFDMTESAVKIWLADLNDEGFNDEDFRKGMTDTRRGAGRYFPTLATLIDNCRPYYTARMEREGYNNKRQDEEKSQRLFNSSLADTPGRKLFCDVLYGRISKQEAAEKMRELDKECPGKGWAEEAETLEKQLHID
jgi:hypothetical protein